MNGRDVHVRPEAAAPEEWTGVRRPFPTDARLQDLFSAQVAARPDAVAVEHGPRQWTYAAIEAQVDRLAGALLRAGVASGDRVGLMLPRSPEMIAALLAILKTGSAYVPLDPAYPSERLRFMIDDAELVAIVGRGATPASLEGARELHSTPWIDLDEPSTGREPVRLSGSTGGLAGAYMMYTSGSTGRPKGVLVPHRAVVRLVWETDYIALGPGEQVAQMAVSSFDASVFEIWSALSSGGRLVILDREDTLAVPNLADSLARYRISVVFLTTALFHEVARHGPSLLAGVGQVFVGGEALAWELAGAVLAHGRPPRLINLYGPTENGTLSTWYPITEAAEEAAWVPIGYPIRNSSAHLVDRDLRPVEVGASGELCTGGPGTAQGYWRRPWLTAERFVPDPFGEEPGGRLYRTGDLARRRHDGALEFLGRIDFQVKVSGFRVELGEIEAALTAHPAVSTSVVVARDDRVSSKYLVAYLVIREGQRLDDVRDFLARRLPDYMVPSVFVELDALPLTRNGKVDRARLPDPRAARVAPADRMPLTTLEEQLSLFTAEILGVENLGVQDDLLTFGADSLFSANLAARVEETLGVELPLRVIFEERTVAGIAQRLAASPKAAARAIPMPRASSITRFPLTPAQERVWFLEQLYPELRAYQFQATMRFRGSFHAGILVDVLAELVRRHGSFRTTFPTDEWGRPQQAVHEPWRPEPLTIDLGGLAPGRAEAELEARCQAEFQRPFDLTRLPLVRWTLFRMTAEDHVLAQVEHHVVHDGWSFNVFLDELVRLYRALSAGRPSPLVPLAVRFGDFAVWQRRWQESSAAEKQLAYWRDRLAGATEVLELPTDRPRPRSPSYRGALRRIALPTELCRDLHRLVAQRRDRTTLYILMLAGFFGLLHRYSGMRDLRIGCGIANRRRPEARRLIGMIINTVVYRVDVAPAITGEALLDQVSEAAFGAYANQELPLERIVDALGMQRDARINPFFQVAFSFHDAPAPDVRLPELSLEVAEGLGNGSAKFDLNLIAVPHAPYRAGARGPDDLTLLWEYSTDLFDAATIDHMVEHYQNLLGGLARTPGKPLRDLPLIDERTRRQLILRGQAETAGEPVEETLPELFAAQVRRGPDRIAVSSGTGCLTYRELDLRANRLAERLRQRGVRPEIVVGVLMERSVDQVVAILGILKAGGAYLPIDPSDPLERAAAVLLAEGVSICLSDGDGAAEIGAALAELGGDREVVVELRALSQEPAPEPEGSPALEPVSGNLCYLIYTSGSTGIPKGVGVTHGNVVRLFHTSQPAFAFDRDDAWTLFHSTAFDFSAWELWGPLLHGGRLAVLSRWESRTPDLFLQILLQERITVLNQTPTAFRQLLQAVLDDRRAYDRHSLRWVILGGEALDLPGLIPWFEVMGDRAPRLVNMYGITETTVHSTFRSLTHADALEGTSSRIGAALPDLSLHVLDPWLEPAPVAVPGEIAVGGAGLSRGYSRHPALTAARFVPDPYGACGERLYRSGDLARILPDDDLEFRGRIDSQVKLRGFRIELGEVEAALGSHPAVELAAAAVKESPGGEARLVGYFVPDAETARPVRGLVDLQRRREVGDATVRELPNRLTVLELNRNETDFLYDEIFRQNGYLRHGVTVGDGDCVFDVGANIGLFSLQAWLQGEEVTVFAFEPVPTACELLRKNLWLYGVDGVVLECALGAREGEESFTHYPKMSILSSGVASRAEAEEAVRSYVRQDHGARVEGVDAASLDELIAERLEATEIRVRTTTLSAVMRLHGVERIDLLKIDVEKGELDVLDGIDEDDWPKIRQVVVEVHDVDGRLDRIRDGLERRGFSVAVDREPSLGASGLCNLYAVRTAVERGDGRGVDSGPRDGSWASTSALVRDLRSHLETRLPPHMVPGAFVPIDSIPINRNGKLDRRALPDPAPARSEPSSVPRTGVETEIAAVWAEVLGLDRVDPADNFFELGGDSILSIVAVSQLRQRGIHTSPRDLFERQTVARLAQTVELQSGAVPAADREAVPTRFDLVPAQSWLLEAEGKGLAEPHHYNQSRLLESATGRFDEGALEAALSAVLETHRALCLRFERDDGIWKQSYGVEGPHLRIVTVDALDGPAAEAEASRTQSSFDLGGGRLLGALVLRAPAGDRLFLAAHVLAIDIVSWTLVIADLETSYRRILEGQPPGLPPESTPYWRWSEGLGALADRIRRDELAYWLDVSTTVSNALPPMASGDEDLWADSHILSTDLRVDGLRDLLTEANSAFRTEVRDLALAAFARGVGRWANVDQVVVQIEAHGRHPELVPGVDLGRTVGRFAAVYPHRLSTGRDTDPLSHLQEVKEGVRNVPSHGVGYGILRYRVGEPGLTATELPEFNFNYRGRRPQRRGWFRTVAGPAGVSHGPRNRRIPPVWVESAIIDDSFRVTLSFGRKRLTDAQAARLVAEILEQFSFILHACLEAEKGRATPSDFSLVRLTRDELEVLPRHIEDVYPLAPNQHGLLFHVLLDPTSSLYFEQIHFELRGPLDSERYLDAWRHLVREQPVLRTVFRWRDVEAPIQVVLGPEGVAPELHFEDLSRGSEAEQQRRIDAYCSGDWRRPFDLEHGPLSRLCVFRVSDGLHRVVWTFHHVILDGWSITNLLAEVARAYVALEGGGDPTPRRARPFRDFVEWLQGRDHEAVCDFWCCRLDGLASPMLLAEMGDGSGGPRRTVRREVVLDRDLSLRLSDWARERRMTRSSLVRALWAALLEELTGRPDVVFGATVSGRNATLPGIEQMVGPFINAVPVRVQLDRFHTFEELAIAVHGDALEATEYEDVVLVDIQKRLRWESGRKLFDTLLIYQNYPTGGRDEPMGGIRLAGIHAREMTHYPFTLGADYRGGHLGFALIYDPALFSEEWVERLARRLEGLCRDVARNPGMRLAERSGEVAPPPELASTAPRAHYPLTFQQEDLWLQSQIFGRPGLNHLSIYGELHGRLDVPRLVESLRTVVGRQAALRASFDTVSGRPVQRVATAVEVPCPLVDLAHLPDQKRERQVGSVERMLVETPYDLRVAPLLRCCVLRWSGERHRFFLTFHHLITDQLYAGELMAQVLDTYRGFEQGAAIAPPPSVGYADFAVWQADSLRSGALEANRRYWSRTLENLPSPPRIATGRPRPATPTLRMGHWLRPLTGQETRELNRASRRRSSSPFRMLTACFLAWVHRLTGQTDLVLAFPVSTYRPELGGTVGFFSNTLPLRVQVEGNLSFEELLRRTSSAIDDLIEHRDFPLTQILERHRGDDGSGVSRLPVCASVIQAPARDLGDLRLVSGPSTLVASPFDLWFCLSRTTTGLELMLMYSLDRFDPLQARRLASSFDSLRESLVELPERPLFDGRMLAKGEIHQLVREAGDGGPRRAGAALAPERVASWAARTPDAVAACHGTAAITYGELERRSSRFARRLLDLGLGVEDRVGLLGARGLGMLTALLGGLRAGAGFVPLDPAQPEARLGSIIADSELRVVATSESLAPRARHLVAELRPRPDIQCWDGDRLSTGPATEDLAGGAKEALSLANVFFTSGSTGKPKGAMVEHRGMLNHLLAKVERFRLGPTSVVAQNASHCFDISVWQALAPLIVGGRVVIYGDDVAHAPGALLGRLAADRVTLLETVPAILDLLLDELDGSRADLELGALQALISNADTLPAGMVRRWLRRVPGAPIVNTYGATECSDDTTHHVLYRSPGPASERVPVGHPIPGVALRVVDAYLNPLPAGVVGEIVMGGIAVGRGYLRDPARTAWAFVPDPLGGEPGARLYRSGDLGLWDDAGALEFVGREDGQVKIHGQRVELAEVESAVRSHPAVTNAAVVWAEGPSGSSRLAAYWVGEAGNGDGAEGLREFLSARLPRHMVPRSIVHLREFPVTPNGKIDRAALPAADGEPTASFLRPEGELEELIAEVWQRALGVSRVGRRDDFFDLGGDSMASIRIAMQLQREGVDVSIRDLFENPSVERLATTLTARSSRTPSDPPGPRAVAVDLDEEEIDELLDLSPSDTRASHGKGDR